MEINIGEIKIEVLSTEHYCTVCDTFSWRCHARHRSGNLFILRFSIPYKEPVFFLLSEGEFKEIRSVNVQSVLGDLVFQKMSGTEIYERGKVTAAGWISFEPVLRVREEDINADQLRKNLTLEERELLYLLLDEHKVALLTKFIAAMVETSSLLRENIHGFIENLDLGVWTHLKPLLHTFASNKVYWVDRACITFIPFSFRAQFELGKIKFKVTKARPETFGLAEYDNVNVVKLGKRKIYVVDSGERVSVYYELPSIVYAYEQYRDQLHPSALLSPQYFKQNMESLFKRRLGDILFIPSESAPSEAKVEQLPDWAGKLRVLQGLVVAAGDSYYVQSSDSDVVLYHPEHGTLTLPAGVYRVERVQYLREGHE
jgi:hypothetical protein